MLAIGPMTNLAIALRIIPRSKPRSGAWCSWAAPSTRPMPNGPAAEFNFWFDPEAARIVLRSGIPEKIMFGLDICNRAPIDKSHFDQIASVKTPITALYRQDLGGRFEKDPDARAYIWDCLAAAYLLDPKFVTKRESDYLDVDTTFGKNYGAVIPLDRDHRARRDAGGRDARPGFRQILRIV